MNFTLFVVAFAFVILCCGFLLLIIDLISGED